MKKNCDHSKITSDKIPINYGGNYEGDLHIRYCEECGEVEEAFID